MGLRSIMNADKKKREQLDLCPLSGQVLLRVCPNLQKDGPGGLKTPLGSSSKTHRALPIGRVIKVGSEEDRALLGKVVVFNVHDHYPVTFHDPWVRGREISVVPRSCIVSTVHGPMAKAYLSETKDECVD